MEMKEKDQALQKVTLSKATTPCNLVVLIDLFKGVSHQLKTSKEAGSSLDYGWYLLSIA